MIIYFAFFKVNNIVFVDESGLNREYRRAYARAKRGVKIHDAKSGKRQKRTNIVAGLSYDIFNKSCSKYLAVQCYEHSTTATFFEDWFEFELIPLLPENALVVMDNASFHRKNALSEIAYRYGINLLFLPPYSPEFNPIEHSWANFKRWLCDNSYRFSCFDFAIEAFFT
jgi:transposase